jgi:hypothetical protein
MYTRRTNYLFSSDPRSGAANITSNGSSFDVYFPDPIRIPYGAKNVELRVLNATVWWTVPNVIAGVNDAFDGFFSTPAIHVSGQIPEGLYDLSALEAACRTLMIQQGVPQAYATDNFSLTPDQSTSKTIITLPGDVTDQVNVGVPNSVFTLCGFPLLSLPAVPVVTVSPEKATFNQISYFLIHSTLTQRGIQFNGRSEQIIAKVLIDVAPGSEISYAPQNPAVASAEELAGSMISQARFWITDQNGLPINTFGESWSVGVEISYDIPF